MDTSRVARDQLGKWINSDGNPHYAVLIKGKWGSGKTYFIRDILSDEKFTKRKTIYISLFGIPSLQEFERRLFFASMSPTKKLLNQGLSFAGSIASGAITLGSGGLLGGSLDLAAVTKKASEAFVKASEAVNQSLIVIDDLERCAFSIRDLLGSLNEFIEHGSARVIVLANIDELSSSEEFRDARDKIFGQEIELSVDTETILEGFIKDLGSSPGAKALAENSKLLAILLHQSRSRNLRATRNFLWLFKSILDGCPAKFHAAPTFVSKFIEQGFIFYFEFHLNLDKSIGHLTLNDLTKATNEEDEDTRFVYAAKPEKDEEPSPAYKVASKYQLGLGLHSLIPISLWVDILGKGAVDYSKLNPLLSSALESGSSDNWPSWKRLWHLQEWDFSDGSDQQFIADVEDLRRGLKEGRYRNPAEFMHVAGVALMLVRFKLIDSTVDQMVRELSSYVDVHLIKDFTYEKYRIVQWDFDSGYDGLGFLGRETKEFGEVFSKLRSAAERWRKSWVRKDLWTEMREKMVADFFGFLGDFVVINRPSLQRFTDEAVLQSFPVSEFVDTWLALPRDRERQLPRMFRDRYRHKPALIAPEKSWWLRVSKELTKRASGASAPRAAQISLLAKGAKGIAEQT